MQLVELPLKTYESDFCTTGKTKTSGPQPDGSITPVSVGFSDTTLAESQILDQNPEIECSPEDILLLKLKNDELLSWKDIAQRFQEEFGKNYHIAVLQMRLKRLRERLRVWIGSDVEALRMAHEYWIDNKFEIIASKVSKIRVQWDALM